MPSSFLHPILADPSHPFSLRNARTGTILADRLLTAFDSNSRNRGLLAHDALKPGTALILAPTFAIHTFFMKFPIDVLFVARDGRVLKVRRAVGPWRVAACWNAFATIEFAASDVLVAAGDRLEIR